MADGKSGVKVIQLTSPESQPKFYGFSPDPKPQLIAWRKTTKAALSLSRGLERDRGVDESGNQIAIFGRIGWRPFNLDEMKKLNLATAHPPSERRNRSARSDLRDATGLSFSLRPKRCAAVRGQPHTQQNASKHSGGRGNIVLLCASYANTGFA